MRARITAELPCWELTLAPSQVVAAAGRLTDVGFAVALDHVPLAALADLDLAGLEPAFIKAQWIRGATDAADMLAAAVARYGAERLVLWHCQEPSALDTGRAAGVTLFQGHAADAAAVAPRRPADRTPHPVAEEPEEPAPALTEAAEPAPPPQPGLLGRLFGRG
jgi:hypothetical protein